jgi:hypothetical protein
VSVEARRGSSAEEYNRVVNELSSLIRKLSEASDKARDIGDLGLALDYSSFMEELISFTRNLKPSDLRLETFRDDTKAYIEAAKIVIQQASLPKPDVVIVANKVKNAIVVSGNTYEIRHILKRHGFKWDRFNKVWKKPLNNSSPEELEELAREIKNEATNLIVEIREAREIKMGRSRVRYPHRRQL